MLPWIKLRNFFQGYAHYTIRLGNHFCDQRRYRLGNPLISHGVRAQSLACYIQDKYLD